MKFSAREDIEAPLDHVYSMVSDFGALERQALRRGASVQRLDGRGPVVVGSNWDVAFTFRGKDRKLKAKLTGLEPQMITVETTSGGIDGVTEIELVQLSASRTRLAVAIELKASSLTARLLLQSLKLAKSNLMTRFKRRIGDYATEIENRYRPRV